MFFDYKGFKELLFQNPTIRLSIQSDILAYIKIKLIPYGQALYLNGNKMSIIHF